MSHATVRRPYSCTKDYNGDAEIASTGKRKYGKGKYETAHFAKVENTSTENASTSPQGWKTQVRKTQVRVLSTKYEILIHTTSLKNKNKIKTVSRLIVKPDGSRYCTSTHRAMTIGGNECVDTLLTKSCMSIGHRTFRNVFLLFEEQHH